ASDHLPVVADYTLGAAIPTIGSFTVSPAVVQSGAPVALTAGNVTEVGGTISTVTFYLESNGIDGLQTDTDTLVGAGSQSGNDWSLSASTGDLGLTPGTYTFYAVATDAAGVSSDVASATLTVTDSGFTGVLLGWDVAGLSNFGPQGFAATQVAA